MASHGPSGLGQGEALIPASAALASLLPTTAKGPRADLSPGRSIVLLLFT